MAVEKQVVKILLVEDNPDDILLIRRAFEEAAVVSEMDVVRDGQEALDYLMRSGQHVRRELQSLPGLILLDINLPKVSGLDVLKQIKSREEVRHIPIVMLTMSKRDEDVLASYDAGCNSFIQKPVEFDKFVRIVREIGQYWGVINTLPYNRVKKRDT